jgi:hypothetical protein
MKTAKKENIDSPREVKLGEPEKKLVKSVLAGLKQNPKVELISYSMKMVIPTGNYANIQPEIIVKAGTVEEAHDYIAPHFNKLWKEYYLVSERRPEPVKPSGVPIVSPATTPGTNPMPPASSVAFTKASQAIASCLSIDALDIIAHQINKSIKLVEDDKFKLIPMLADKRDELNGKVNPA